MIGRELLIHTTWRARNYWWQRGDGFELAGGSTVEDVAQEVMVKALSGIRTWDPARGQLLPWLQAQSNSLIDALAKSAAHHHEVNLLKAENLAVDLAADPLEIVLEQETRAHLEQKVNLFLQAVETEPELREVLEVILGGCQPRPRYIAVELGVSVKEVNNRLKRLRRLAMSSLMRQDS